ncbi:MAG: AsmA-like C-terminal region-containing protein [Verrucomicrobia bacterium]|nr:AsmA-like C-terminal region-containing protein [Verrucomicrobiota bacterium]
MMLRKIKYGAFIVFIVVLVAGLYLSLIGLPDVLARNVEKRLQFSDLVVTLAKVKLGVFEGIIATQVRCHRKGDIGVPLLEAEKIVLRLHPLAWLKGKNGVSGALIKNGVVSVPLQSATTNDAALAGMERFDCQVLFARVAWDEDATRLRVEECSARMPGIKLTGRGELVLPREGVMPTRPAPGGSEKKHEVRLVKLLKAWGQCGLSTNGSGVVNVDVTGFLDPADMNALDVQVQADARRTCFRKTVLGAWCLKLSMKGASGEGVLDLIDADIEGAHVAKINGRFRFDEQNLILQSLDATVGKNHWRGPLHLSGVYDWKTRQCQGALTTAFNPNALLPLLYALDLPHASVIEWFQFEDQPPAGKADFKFAVGTNWLFHLTGHAQGDNCQYHGVTNLLMKSDLVIDFSPTNASLILTPLLAVREEGTVQGGACLDFIQDTVGFNGLSTADPQAVAKMLATFIANVVGQFRFEGPTKVAAWGTAGYKDLVRNDMDIEIDTQRSGWKQFIMDRCSLSLRVVEDTAYINDVQADFCRGLVRGSGSVYPVLNATNLRYHLQGNVREVNLQMLARHLAGQAVDQYHGALSGQLALDGFLDDPGGQTATGQGWIKIGAGRLFQFPLFGGLSEFLGRIVPGLSLIMRQTDARASFVIKDGKIHSDNIIIEGEVITLTCEGDYRLNGELDFAVQVKLLKKNTLVGGILHLAMMPVTKMLEFRLTGTVKDPHWRPAYLPKEMFFIFD